jgi:hypothetical protein
LVELIGYRIPSFVSVIILSTFKVEQQGEVKGESRDNDINIAEGSLSREGRRELEGRTQMKGGNQGGPEEGSQRVAVQGREVGNIKGGNLIN